MREDGDQRREAEGAVFYGMRSSRRGKGRRRRRRRVKMKGPRDLREAAKSRGKQMGRKKSVSLMKGWMSMEKRCRRKKGWRHLVQGNL